MSVERAPVDEQASIEDLGRELGERIARTPEYERFEDTREAVQRDEEVQAKIDEFERLRAEFMQARQTGQATNADLNHVQDAQDELHSMPVMSEFLDAQDELTATLEMVNEAISDPLAVDFGGEAGGCCQD
ncbi:YlbF family regulator [Halorubrum trueperi]|uniref:YlbF family regulator n=1 Tax=Halorubrum trueperi TaxID=2004704 RepID=A0ABD5UPW3_9EURY